MKRLIGLLVVLLVLALGVFFLEKPRIDEQKAEREGLKTAKKLFADISQDSITRIVINDGMSEKTIRKGDDGKWKISDDGTNFWETNPEKIDELLKDISDDLTDETLASESADKHDMFEVTETLGTKVQIFTDGDKPAGVFFVGKQGPDYISTYVRRDGDNNTYSIPIQLDTIYGRETNGWRDKTMWKFDPKTIVEATFKFGESSYGVKLDNGEWLLTQPEQTKANGIKIESELKALSEVEGAGFVPKTLEEAYLDKPESEIHLKAADGTEHVLYISKEDEGYYNTYIAGRPEAVLKVPKADLGPLFINAISQLRFDPEVASPAEDGSATEAPTGDSEPSPQVKEGAADDGAGGQ